jgi:WD40 repeat protein/tRNA A-37 threonylcarbamoyl transferase component Bud32
MLTIIGKIIGGRYEITNLLANGGFSNTYLARDKQLPTKPYCVVKHFKPKPSNSFALETARNLFDTEAEILYDLRQINARIPKLLAYFEEDEEFYLVEEFIEGKDLSYELIPGKQLSEDRVIDLLQDILSTLKIIHNQGVIHRDLKPQNLIRCQENDNIFLIDFGAVKQISLQLNSQMFLNQNEGQLDTTIVIGTPGYMPTEQQAGKPRFSSDIYAAGTIAIQALTGLSPTRLSEDAQTGEILWHEWAKVNPKLSTILDKMVSPHFKDRYQSADFVLQDLDKLNNSLKKRTILNSSIKQKFVRSNLKWLVAGTILLLGTAGWNWLEVDKITAWRSQTTQSKSIFTNKSSIDRIALANTLTVHSDAVFSLAISPNGREFLSGSGDNTIKLWNLQTGELLYEFVGHSKEVVTTKISSDGQTLVSGSRDGTVKLWNLKTKQLLHTLKGHTDKVTWVAISPDGQTLFSGDEADKIKVWNFKTGQFLRDINGHSDEIESLVITRDGQILISASEDKTIRMWNSQTGRLLRTLTKHNKGVESLAIHPDGETFVSGGKDKIIFWQLATGKLLRELPQSGFVRCVTFSPDGKTLISSHEDNTIKLWNLSNGKLLRTLSGHSDWVLSVAISPDGQTLLSGSRDKTIGIWNTQ